MPAAARAPRAEESTRKPLGYMRREFQANTRSHMHFRISSVIPEIHKTAGEFAFEYQTKKRSKAPEKKRAARRPAKKTKAKKPAKRVRRAKAKATGAGQPALRRSTRKRS